MNVYLGLLRGINVGGKNVIPMNDLRDCLTELGLQDVRTYIQSGNVLFRAPSADESRLEAGLAERFDYHGRLLVMSRRRFLSSVAQAPPWWDNTDTHRHNALFTLSGITPQRVLRALPPPSEYETIATAPGVIFWTGLKSRLTRTMFVSKLAGHPMYQELTVRNSRTTHKLAELLDGM